jgi:hypothetical protein
MTTGDKGKVQCCLCGRIGDAKIYKSFCPHCCASSLGAYAPPDKEPIQGIDPTISPGPRKAIVS